MFNTIEDIIKDIHGGKMIILTNDEDPDREGYILVAAELVSPSDINFMARHGRGLICLTITEQRFKQLNLKRMVQSNERIIGSDFTCSIEASEGVTTGISAYDRAHTIQVAVARNAGPNDISEPGHVFPLVAQLGGVLARAGHTEAACDIAQLAELEPACVIVGILNDDGSMARRTDLEVFAEKHGLKIGTIADVIRYRLKEGGSITRLQEGEISTGYGVFNLVTYRDDIKNHLHYALCKGSRYANESTLVRVHVRDTVDDLLLQSSKKWTIPETMQRINRDGGVFLIMSKDESEDYLIERIQSAMSAEPETDASRVDPQPTSYRIGIGSQILRDLGVTKTRLLSTKQTKYIVLSGFGLEVEEYIYD